MRLTVVVAVLVGSLISVTGGAAASGALRQHHEYSVAAGDILDKQYRPRLMELTGDGTLTMHRSRWHVWNRREARGRGVGWLENCNPDCGHSTHISRVKMHLRAYRVRLRCGMHVFTRYREAFVRKPRPDVARVYVAHVDRPACNA